MDDRNLPGFIESIAMAASYAVWLCSTNEIPMVPFLLKHNGDYVAIFYKGTPPHCSSL
jgi:hypothetical protein